MIELTLTAIACTILYLLLIDRLARWERTEEERRRLEAELDEAEARKQERRKRLEVVRPSACKDCVEYYGLAHGGVRLICAIHPYGVDGESCPDWK